MSVVKVCRCDYCGADVDAAAVGGRLPKDWQFFQWRGAPTTPSTAKLCCTKTTCRAAGESEAERAISQFSNSFKHAVPE